MCSVFQFKTWLYEVNEFRLITNFVRRRLTFASRVSIQRQPCSFSNNNKRYQQCLENSINVSLWNHLLFYTAYSLMPYT